MAAAVGEGGCGSGAAAALDFRRVKELREFSLLSLLDLLLLTF